LDPTDIRMSALMLDWYRYSIQATIAAPRTAIANDRIATKRYRVEASLYSSAERNPM
jgi:hypothetical protein